MKRANAGTRVVLKPRDSEIFQLLNRYRYLRSTFIHAFVGGKLNRFKERLGHLYHEGGYLNRPHQQWQFYNARYMPAIYENSEAAEDLLEEQGLLGPQTTWLLRGRMGAHRQFAHSLMICDILASVELGIRETDNLRFIGWQEILARAPEATKRLQNPFSIPVNIAHTAASGKTHSAKTAIIPDALFGIEYTTAGKKTYRWFAVEADRRTMPVFRTNLQETSFLKKILSYRDIRQNELYKSHFGISNLMVLTVTTNETHMQHIKELVGKITGGSKMFCFKTMPSLGDMAKAPAPTPDMLTKPWARVGHPDFYIDKE